MIVSGGTRRSTFSSRPAGQHDHAGVEAARLHARRPRPCRPARRRPSGRCPARRARRVAADVAPEAGDGPLARGGGPVERPSAPRARRAWPARRRSATGLPPKVEPWAPVGQRSISARRRTMPPSGRPEAMPLANSTTSGRTPKASAANGRPVRPTPHCTSSNTSRMPCASHRSRRPGQPGPRRRARSRPRPAPARRSWRRRWSGGACSVEQLVELGQRGRAAASSAWRARAGTQYGRVVDAGQQRLVALAVLALGRGERVAPIVRPWNAAPEGDDPGPAGDAGGPA